MSPRDVYLLTVSATPLIAALVVLCWVASLVRRDSSLVDRVWGLGFVLLVHHHTAFAGEVGGTVDRLFAALVVIWGIRLTWHITHRNWGHGEDPRYAAMRARNGARWWWQSLFTVFVLQGALMLLIGLPLAATAMPGAAWGRALGTLLWAVGFAFEAGGDWQLARFKADSANRGQVLDTGFWRYTRHPNYFGDALQWWGFWCFAASAGLWWTIISPILMTLLLLKVSGVTLLESALVDAKPGYREYIRRTPAFFPWWPRER
ncbi:MAG: DUF1295 domain-containing protein [Gemmatimonadetes bacterium]|nr:DUF1295 domain-containing protein [Gemmatimonadota bacterium]